MTIVTADCDEGYLRIDLRLCIPTTSPAQSINLIDRYSASSDVANDRLAGDERVSEEWGLLVRRFRVRHGLTQQHIADMFGVSQRTVSRWERSENKPSPQCQRHLRDLGCELPEGGYDSFVAPVRHSPILGGLSRTCNLTPQALSERDAALEEDRMPIALADRVVALLSYLSADDIARLSPAERRRLADRCRRVAQLAEPRSGTSGKAKTLADMQKGRRSARKVRQR